MTDKQKFIDFIEAQKGKPYLTGEEGPDSYDCSGLIYAGLKEITSADIPRTSTDQYALGKSISIGDVIEGDLIFFDTGWVERKPNHNGMCTSSSEMINANSYYNEVKEEVFNTGYWGDKIYGSPRRIFDDDGNLDLSSGGSSETEHFSDVPSSHEFYEYIEELYDKGVISGYDDGTFKPDDTINRVESLKIILEAMEIPANDSFNPLPFPDTDDGQWYAKYVAAAVANGIVDGYDDGTFKPDNNINRAEMCKIIFEAGGVSPSLPGSSSYNDVAISSWFAKYALKAIDWDMFEPDSSNVFGSGNYVKRGEMCKAIVKFLEER